MDATALLDSAAGGWWYPAVVVAAVLAFAVWKAFHFDPDRPGETVLPTPVLTGGALLVALPLLGHLIVHGTMPKATLNSYVLVVLAGMGFVISIRELLRGPDRRSPRQ